MANIGVDILGMQEVVTAKWTRTGRGNAPVIAKFMTAVSQHTYGWHQTRSSAIFYNKDRVGTIDHLSNIKGSSGVRSVCGVYVVTFLYKRQLIAGCLRLVI